MAKHLLTLLISSLLAVSLFADVLANPQFCVKDYEDNNVCLQKAAQRIVALAPHITENLFSIGAGKRIIATVDYADFPSAAQSLPRVGGYNISSIETIVAHEPDLVVFWGSGNSRKVLQQLQRLKIPVYIDEPGTLADIARSLKALGTLTGHSQEADMLAEDFLNKLKRLEQKQKREQPLEVFYQIWNDPLQTLNGTHITSNLISLCGGKNIFAEEKSIAPVVSREAIFSYNPEVILASGVKDERPVWLDDWKHYPQLRAVKNNQLLVLSADLSQRHSLRILEGAELLCEMFSQVQ